MRQPQETQVLSLGQEDPLGEEMAAGLSILAWEIPWVGKIPWGRKWQPAPGFLPGTSHGQRSLADYNPRSRQESDRT